MNNYVFKFYHQNIFVLRSWTECSKGSDRKQTSRMDGSKNIFWFCVSGRGRDGLWTRKWWKMSLNGRENTNTQANNKLFSVMQHVFFYSVSWRKFQDEIQRENTGRCLSLWKPTIQYFYFTKVFTFFHMNGPFCYTVCLFEMNHDHRLITTVMFFQHFPTLDQQTQRDLPLTWKLDNYYKISHYNYSVGGIT